MSSLSAPTSHLRGPTYGMSQTQSVGENKVISTVPRIWCS